MERYGRFARQAVKVYYVAPLQNLLASEDLAGILFIMFPNI